jgi:hypothetical protein
VPNFSNSILHYQRNIRWHGQLNLEEKGVTLFSTITYILDCRKSVQYTIS